MLREIHWQDSSPGKPKTEPKGLYGPDKYGCTEVITEGLPKPNALHLANHIILESSTDGILPVHGTIMLEGEHYKTGKLMPIRFFIVDT